jgi:carbonic anhydrase
MRILPIVIACLAASGLRASEHETGANPEAVLKGLLAGNHRYVTGHPTHPHQTLVRVKELAKGQHPGAIVLACADSRVAPEVLFDQGLGDLFVLRVAGNVVNDENLASMEYAVEHLGTRLIVVLGHERCGAVSAAVDGGKVGGHLVRLMEDLLPAVEDAKGKQGDKAENAMRANVVRMVAKVSTDETLGSMVKGGQVKVVGARYDLDTGEVTLTTQPTQSH